MNGFISYQKFLSAGVGGGRTCGLGPYNAACSFNLDFNFLVMEPSSAVSHVPSRKTAIDEDLC